jgi:hypothetical protein
MNNASLFQNVLGSTYVSDIFWHLFVPYTHFHLKILPVIRRKESETTEDYCRRAEKIFADSLKLEVSNFTNADKAELLKREIFQPRVPNQHAQSGIIRPHQFNSLDSGGAEPRPGG